MDPTMGGRGRGRTKPSRPRRAVGREKWQSHQDGRGGGAELGGPEAPRRAVTLEAREESVQGAQGNFEGAHCFTKLGF